MNEKTSNEIRCLECGTLVNKDVSVCPYCGFPIRESVEFGDYDDAEKYLEKMNTGCLLQAFIFVAFIVFCIS